MKKPECAERAVVVSRIRQTYEIRDETGSWRLGEAARAQIV